MTNRRVVERYFAIEGIDGAGKSTQVKLLETYLTDKGIDHRVVSFTSKSSGLPGRAIRTLYDPTRNSWVLRKLQRNEPLKLALFAFNGRHNLARISASRVDRQVVIGDRSVITARVFHWELLNRAPFLWCLEARALPRKVLLLDINPIRAFERLMSRGEIGTDESKEMLHKLRLRYLNLANGKSKNELGMSFVEWSVIDASRSESAIHEDVVAWLLKCLGQQWPHHPDISDDAYSHSLGYGDM